MRSLFRRFKTLFKPQLESNRSTKQVSGSSTAEFDNIPSTAKLSARLAMIRKVLGESIDLVIREFEFEDESNISAAVIYLDGMVDNVKVDQNILTAMMFQAQSIQAKEKLSPKKAYDKLVRNRISMGEIMEKEKNSELFAHLVSGDTIIIIDGYIPFIAANTRAWEKRNVAEPENESVVRGPREGFNESLKVGLSMVRRRLKTPYLRFETFYIGRQTQTTVVLAYISNLANPKLIREVKERLQRINTDAIVSTGYLEDYLEDNPFSPFPQLKATERPDVVVAGLLEGRAAVLADNTPFAIIAPTTFFEFLQGADDYYQRPWYGGALVRWLRLIAINIALLLPAFYVATITFHQEMIPTALLVSIAASREGVPFPAVVEALIMEGTFELLREAGLRLPSPIGTAVSIVGALVLGEAAIRAGIVSPPMVIVVALTAIASFSLPGFAAALSLRQMRFPLILLAAVMGLFGVMFGLLVILIHLVSLRSFGVPYMSPLAPLMPRDLKDTFARPPQWAMSKRPRYLRSQDAVRQGEDLMPHPPNSRKKKK